MPSRHTRDNSVSSEGSTTSILVNAVDAAQPGDRRRVSFNVTFEDAAEPTRSKTATLGNRSKRGSRTSMSAESTHVAPRQLKKAQPGYENRSVFRTRRPTSDALVSFDMVRVSCCEPSITLKELPPLPPSAARNFRASLPVLPRLHLGAGHLEVPAELLSPAKLPEEVTEGSATPIPRIAELPASPPHADEGIAQCRGDPRNSFSDHVDESVRPPRVGRVSADDVRRMTEVWVTMLNNDGFLRAPSPSGSMSASSSANTFLAVPNTEAVSPAPSSDCCDPAVLQSRVARQSSSARDSILSVHKPLPPSPSPMLSPPPNLRPLRASLNPFEVNFLSASGGFLSPPSPQRRASSPAVLDSPSAARTPIGAQPLFVVPVALTSRLDEDVFGPVKPAPQISSEAFPEGKYGGGQDEKSRPLSYGPAYAYHNRFRRRCASANSAQELALTSTSSVPLQGARSESFGSTSSTPTSSGSMTDDLSETLRSSTLATISDASESASSSPVYATTKQPRDKAETLHLWDAFEDARTTSGTPVDAFSRFLARVEASQATPAGSTQGKRLSTRTKRESTRGMTNAKHKSTRSRSSTASSVLSDASRQSNLEIVMYGVAL